MDRNTPSTQTARALLVCAALLLSGLAWATPAHAQGEIYTFTAGLLGSVGGSQDATPGDDLGNTGFQINLSMITQPGEHLVVRLGKLGLGDGGQFGSQLTDADLSYVTIGGEYRYRHTFYDSGVYIALGGYKLAGTNIFTGVSEDDTTIGLAAGVSGEFPINRWLGVAVEFSGHYADFNAAQIFVMGNAGLVVHF